MMSVTLSLSATPLARPRPPKCVVYSHRGAYLNSFSSILLTEIKSMPVYLWTVPMVHCNGWCQAWAVAAQGGTNVCLRNVTAKGIFDAIANHGVTDMGGAPTFLNMISNAGASERRPLPGRVAVQTCGAPPHPRVLSEMEEQGFDITHACGLTETYRPGTICAWQPEWDALLLRRGRSSGRARACSISGWKMSRTCYYAECGVGWGGDGRSDV